MIQRLRVSQAHYSVSFIEANRILGALLSVQPITALNALFPDAIDNDPTTFSGFMDHGDLLGSPLDAVQQDILLSWCNQEPETRFVRIASAMQPLVKDRNNEVLHWKAISLAFMDLAPDPVEVLKRCIERFRTGSYQGSFAEAWESTIKLLDSITVHSNPKLAAFAVQERSRLRAEVAIAKQQEQEQERRQNERFE